MTGWCVRMRFGSDVGDEKHIWKLTMREICHVISLSVTALSLFIGSSCCWSQSQLSLGEGRLLPGPSLMEEAAIQGANCTSGAIWGSVSSLSV